MAADGANEKYLMEENPDELVRLANQHYTLKSGMGTLTLAPVDFTRPDLKILDSGTADGLWLRDLQASIPTLHQCVGTDIVPLYFPKKTTPGLSFKVQSITQAWPDEWSDSFDYVHQRLTLPGAGPHPMSECVARLVALAKPGGWVELVEADFSQASQNGPVVQQFESMMMHMLDFTGIGRAYASELHDCLERSGCKEVHTRVFSVPHGIACTLAEVAKMSTSHIVSAAKGLSLFFQSQEIKIDAVDLSASGRESFLQKLREELESRGAVFKMTVVWAERPSGDQRND